ncbi:hypothetical protein [Micromonospora globbae]|uniref:Uncharacterized protein n=1 Tax=Micromonospora globbae TaxID=1894969 RepID=A0A420F2Y1_9ACTN|nr:hypothetical protein [Micromonospora globbae]RKF27334.1 hypothetical protein D7I43_09675 [Micromonospora globbae]WTF86575.1 hypothetical protein OH732_02905 [Micromonospora globbae]
MTDVLHVQTRAYPLHYTAVDRTVDRVVVPGRGELRPVPGTLGSVAYNSEETVEVDLTAMVRAAISLPDLTIVACRIRILAAGAVLLTYALRHANDLRKLDAHELATMDASVNRQLREADRALLRDVLAGARQSGLFAHVVVPPGGASADDWTEVHPRAVRYNCHFIARDPVWEPDRRVPGLVLGAHCRILLPYTYAWDDDPAPERIDEILTMLEPADIAVAQQSVLVGASVGGLQILTELARAAPGRLEGPEFRRFLDGVWADYHRLDAYRVESGQDHRATYIAARETIGLDGTHERAEKLLAHVNASLLAESSLRSERLDGRLNRVAAALTVVASAAFLLDIAAFLLPEVGNGTKMVTVSGVILLAAGMLAATILWSRERDARENESPDRGPAGNP